MFQILFPLVGSPVDDGATTHARNLAKLLSAKVHLVRVLESRRSSDRPTDPVDWTLKRSEAEAALARAAARLGDAGVETAQTLLEGDPTEHLLNYARQNHADLILLVSGPRRGALGMSGGELLWRSYHTTLVLRSDEHGNVLAPERYRRVLVALDGSMRAECVLPWTQMLAEQGGKHEVEVVLAHVVTEPELPRLTPATDEDRELAERLMERNREEASAYLEGVRSRLGVPAETRLLQGRKVSSALHDLVDAGGMDLVVLSAHGYGGESRWPFGDVATSFIDYGSTPLLLVQDMPKHESVRAAVTAESWGG